MSAAHGGCEDERLSDVRCPAWRWHSRTRRALPATRYSVREAFVCPAEGLRGQAFSLRKFKVIELSRLCHECAHPAGEMQKYCFHAHALYHSLPPPPAQRAAATSRHHLYGVTTAKQVHRSVLKLPGYLEARSSGGTSARATWPLRSP